MPDMSKRILIVDLPADRPKLRTAFEQLASHAGWRQSFQGRDEETGEIAIIQFHADSPSIHNPSIEGHGGRADAMSSPANSKTHTHTDIPCTD